MSSTKEPAAGSECRTAFIRPPFYWLLLCAPAAAALDAASAPALVVFLATGLALVPLATLIVHSTEGIG